MKRATADGEELRLLRGLSARGARLFRDPAGRYRLESGASASRASIEPAIVEKLRERDLVAAEGDCLVLSSVGRSHVRRSLASAESFRAQHQVLEIAAIVDDRGALSHVAVDRGESPLAGLRYRRGRDGRPLIDTIEFAAGERLRSDFDRGRMQPRVTANWSAVAVNRRAGGVAELTEAAIGARRRVERALDEVGPEFGGLLLDVCCFLKGLEEIERERRWPARSAKLVLRLGLGALARHYGLMAKARGRRGTARIVHWGTEDYRPSIE